MFELDGCLPYGKNVAVSVTNACPLECKHCITNSTPRSDRALPNFETILTKFLARDDLGAVSVTMTGGEPFYDLDQLKQLGKLAFNQGLSVGAITSAFWAKSVPRANMILDQLAGLTLLTLSTDVHHTDFVPREFVKNAYVAGKARGIRTHIRVCVQLPYTEGDKEILDYVRTFCDEEEVEIQQVIPYGKSSQHEEFHKQEFTRQPHCPALGPHLLNNGEIIPCCNSIVPLRGKHPLYIGDSLDETPLSKSILDNILFVTLKVWGVDSIAECLYGEIGQQSACDVCATTRCSRRLLQKNGDARRQARGRHSAPGRVRGERTAGVCHARGRSELGPLPQLPAGRCQC
jgi:pyruvate-formate lyase-activating enzyme